MTDWRERREWRDIHGWGLDRLREIIGKLHDWAGLADGYQAICDLGRQGADAWRQIATIQRTQLPPEELTKVVGDGRLVSAADRRIVPIEHALFALLRSRKAIAVVRVPLIARSPLNPLLVHIAGDGVKWKELTVDFMLDLRGADRRLLVPTAAAEHLGADRLENRFWRIYESARDSDGAPSATEPVGDTKEPTPREPVGGSREKAEGAHRPLERPIPPWERPDFDASLLDGSDDCVTVLWRESCRWRYRAPRVRECGFVPDDLTQTERDGLPRFVTPSARPADRFASVLKNVRRYPHAHQASLGFDRRCTRWYVLIWCMECGSYGRLVHTQELWQVDRCRACKRTRD